MFHLNKVASSLRSTLQRWWKVADTQILHTSELPSAWDTSAGHPGATRSARCSHKACLVLVAGGRTKGLVARHLCPRVARHAMGYHGPKAGDLTNPYNLCDDILLVPELVTCKFKEYSL